MGFLKIHAESHEGIPRENEIQEFLIIYIYSGKGFLFQEIKIELSSSLIL
jgi:hypothetical protein